MAMVSTSMKLASSPKSQLSLTQLVKEIDFSGSTSPLSRSYRSYDSMTQTTGLSLNIMPISPNKRDKNGRQMYERWLAPS